MTEEIPSEIDRAVRAAIRCVDEAWIETPRPERDGTKMVLIPEELFKRLSEAVEALKKSGEWYG